MHENFKFCDEVFLGITNRTDTKIRIDAYTDMEKTVVLIYQTVGLIGNMGLAGFLSNEYDGDPGFFETICAYERIGDRVAINSLTEAKSIHRLQSELPTESEEYAKLAAKLDRLDDICIENEERTIDLLANFIQGNRLHTQ